MTNEELRAEFEHELKEEAIEEYRMRADTDYALSKFEEEIFEAHEILLKVSKKLRDYGWEYTPSELLEEL